MQVRPKNQKISYQTPKLEMLGMFMLLTGGSPIRVPIQVLPPITLDLPFNGERQ